jgi:hypothetical protein
MGRIAGPRMVRVMLLTRGLAVCASTHTDSSATAVVQCDPCGRQLPGVSCPLTAPLRLRSGVPDSLRSLVLTQTGRSEQTACGGDGPAENEDHGTPRSVSGRSSLDGPGPVPGSCIFTHAAVSREATRYLTVTRAGKGDPGKLDRGHVDFSV